MLLIDGEWRDSPRHIEIRNPYTGQIVGRQACASVEDVQCAVAAARRFRSNLTAFDRAEILRRTADRVQSEASEYARSICQESGLSIRDAQKEVARAVNLLRVCAEEAKRLTGESLPTDITDARQQTLTFTLREPIGVVCAITPFNRPLNQVVVKLGPALAANNAVVLKPSEKTPLTAVRFARALLDEGLPPRMLSLVTGDPDEIGDALVTSPCVDMVTFTGSQAVGERIARRVGMIKTTFELGDSGALIVLADADVDAAVKATVAGAYSTAGQSCRGVKRVLVHDAVAATFAERLTASTSRLVVGDPMDPGTDIGTLINEASARMVESRVNDAIARGASLLCGGRREGAHVWPTVLDMVPRQAPLVAEETFGPIAPIVRISGLDDAIEYVNASDFGLQAGVFTRSLPAAMDAIRRLRTGAVIVNHGPQFESPNIPFGGVRKSGLGREGIRYAIAEMTTVKTAVLCQ